MQPNTDKDKAIPQEVLEKLPLGFQMLRLNDTVPEENEAEADSPNEFKNEYDEIIDEYFVYLHDKGLIFFYGHSRMVPRFKLTMGRTF